MCTAVLDQKRLNFDWHLSIYYIHFFVNIRRTANGDFELSYIAL